MTNPPPRTMPHTFARQEATIKRLQRELDAIRNAMRCYPDSDLVSLAQSLATANEHYEACLAWSRQAYTRLNNLLALRVSMSPDVVTATIVNAAPEVVKGGVENK